MTYREVTLAVEGYTRHLEKHDDMLQKVAQVTAVSGMNGKAAMKAVRVLYPSRRNGGKVDPEEVAKRREAGLKQLKIINAGGSENTGRGGRIRGGKGAR